MTPALVVEDYLDAIVQTVKAMGGYKPVGALLRPDLDPVQAGRWLADCCNPNERAQLQVTQLALIRRTARARDVHTLMVFECGDAGYAAPQPVEPADALAQLQRQFSESVRMQAELVARMEALSGFERGRSGGK